MISAVNQAILRLDSTITGDPRRFIGEDVNGVHCPSEITPSRDSLQKALTILTYSTFQRSLSSLTGSLSESSELLQAVDSVSSHVLSAHALAISPHLKNGVVGM